MNEQVLAQTHGWHTEAMALKRFAERRIFNLTKGFRLKDVAESLVANPLTGPFVASQINTYVMAPFVEKKLIFVHIPKNAGTSIGRSLYGAYGTRLAHYTASFYRSLMPKFFDRTPSFAILRDPVDRFLSSYFFIRNHGGDVIDLYPEWIRIYEDFDVANMTLDEFIDLQRTLSWQFRRLDYVMRPQAEFILDHLGDLMVTNVFVMGHHDNELRRFMARNGATTIPHLNRTARRSLKVSVPQRRAILDLYPQDAVLMDRLNCPIRLT
jgi:hypothetical protein